VTDADCSAIEEHANWDLCESGPGFCTAVFYDSAGCVAVCAAVGMVCHSVMENIDGQCAADLDRPPLACQPESGHKSDWCHCVDPQTCVPQCLGKTCGDDGCGGNCGLCAATDACQGFQCVPKTTGPDCSTLPYDPQALLAERVGFGATTTGGSPGNVYHVTSKANSGPGTLRHALESTENYWIVFDVEGEFQCTFSQTIQVKSNKTVDGRGRDVRLRDCRFDIKPGVQNLIFTDFEAYFHDPQDNEGDLFYARGPGSTSPDSYTTKRIWWHHLDLHHAGDGLIDIRGATSITISWCHFHNHTKVMLHTYDMDENPDPGKHITYHHNWFDTVTRRGPQFAYGKADFFNNYQYHWYEYGAASVDNAQFLSEANIYEAREGTVCIIPCPDPSPHGGGNDFIVSKKGLVNDWAPKDSVGFIRSVGDWKLNGAQVTEHQPSTVFLRSTYYQATPEPANDALRQKIKLEAGPRKQYCP
jgi:pectate lyase